MRKCFGWLVVLSTSFLVSSAWAASPVIDDVNDGETPDFSVFSANIDNLGWIYQPSFSYMLDGITSTFRAVTNPPVTTRDVTLSVYDDVPSAGGNLLRSGTFSAGGAGGDLGIMFAPLQLQAGETYFVALSNLATPNGLGVDLVTFTTSLPPPQPTPNPPWDFNPNIDFLEGWYTGANFGTHFTVDDSPGFAAPILRFHGVVPEPSAVALVAIAFGLFSYRGARRNSAG
jgi:hypothetical protein